MALFWQRKKEEKEKVAAREKTKQERRGWARLTRRKAKAVVQEVEKPVPAKATKAAKAAKAAKAEKPTKPKPKPRPTDTGDAYKILLGPVITEKTTRLAEENTYVFAVAPDANKISIAKAVKVVFSVDPIKVTVANIPGKPKRFAQRLGQRTARHKAYVTLKAGQSIELFEKV